MRVLYPLIMVVAMIRLVDAATAADIDTAYLRGSESASPAAPPRRHHKPGPGPGSISAVRSAPPPARQPLPIRPAHRFSEIK